jgi:5'-3' exonuclease
VSSTISLLGEEGVTHVGVAFDSVIESFRNEMFDGYKTGEGTPPELYAQFPVAERAMEALGVVVWSMIEQEADDGLAAAATKFAPDVERVVILSPDKDMSQLYGDPKIVGFDRRKAMFIDTEGVWEKFGVAPDSIPDYLALVGDTADGIPGLAGWGAKSTAAVLAEYTHLDRVPASEQDWAVKVRSASRLAATLRDNMPAALLYRDLATLRIDADIPQTLDELEWRGAHRAEFLTLCDELDFGSIRNRPKSWVD